MAKRFMAGYAKITNNGVIGYLKENEIKALCSSVGASPADTAGALARANNINHVVFSRMTK